MYCYPSQHASAYIGTSCVIWKHPQRWTWTKELKNKAIYWHNTYIDRNMYIINLANMPIHPLGNWNYRWRLRWRRIGLEAIPAIGGAGGLAVTTPVIISSVHNLLLFGDVLLSRGMWFIQEVFLLHSDPTIVLHGLIRCKSSWVFFALGWKKGKLAFEQNSCWAPWVCLRSVCLRARPGSWGCQVKGHHVVHFY